MSAFRGLAVTGVAVLSPEERRLLLAIADAPGATEEDLAATLGMTAPDIRRLMASERVRAAIDAATRAARKGPRAIRELAVKGAQILSPSERRLLGALAEAPCATQEDLASVLGMTARHVRRLMASERLRAALDAAAREGLRDATSVLGRGATRAARTLISMCDGTTLALPGRVAACRTVLEAAGRLFDLLELEQRIVALEGRQPEPMRQPLPADHFS